MLDSAERFKMGPHNGFHVQLVEKEAFKACLEAAVLVWQDTRNTTQLHGDAEAMWHRLEGIREFIDIFLGLSAVPKDPPPPIRQNLKPV